MGQVSDRRVSVDMADLDGWPDGPVVDADRNIREAIYDGGVSSFSSRAAGAFMRVLNVQRPTSSM